MRYFHVTRTNCHVPVRFANVEEITEDEHTIRVNCHSTLGYFIVTDDVGSNPTLQKHGIKPVLDIGEEEGEYCGQPQPDGSLCSGLLESREPDGGCSCHCGNPPCSYCTAGRLYCEECGYEEENH